MWLDLGPGPALLADACAAEPAFECGERSEALHLLERRALAQRVTERQDRGPRLPVRREEAVGGLEQRIDPRAEVDGGAGSQVIDRGDARDARVDKGAPASDHQAARGALRRKIPPRVHLAARHRVHPLRPGEPGPPARRPADGGAVEHQHRVPPLVGDPHLRRQGGGHTCNAIAVIATECAAGLRAPRGDCGSREMQEAAFKRVGRARR